MKKFSIIIILLLVSLVFASEIGLRKLTSGSYEGSPSYWHGNNKLVYVARVSGETDLYVFDLSNGKSSRLLDLPGSIEREPAVSPDGRYITYISAKPDSLWILNVYDSRTKRTRAFTEIQGSCMTPSFSLDSGTILFSNDRSGDWDIYSIEVNGKNLKQIKLPGNQKNPVETRTGIFYLDNQSGKYEIYRRSSDNRSIRMTMEGRDHTGLGYDFNEGILYFAKEDILSTIWVADEDFIRQEQITFVGSDSFPTYDSENGDLYFESDRETSTNIWSISYSKTRLENIASSVVEDVEIKLFEENLLNLAFLETENLSLVEDEVFAEFAEMMISKLVDRQSALIIDRNRLEQVLKELRYNQSDMINPEKRKEVGRILKIEGFAYATAIDLLNPDGSNSTLLLMKLVDADSSRLIWSNVYVVKGNQNPLLFSSRLSFKNFGHKALTDGFAPGNTVFWNVEAKGNLPESYIRALTEFGLSTSEYMTALDRDTVEEILKEKRLEMSGWLDPYSVLSQEEIAGVQSVVYGHAYTLDSEQIVTLHLLSVRDGRLLDTVIFRTNETGYMIVESASEIIDELRAKSAGKKTAGFTLNVPADVKKELVQLFEDSIMSELSLAGIYPVNRDLMNKYVQTEIRAGREIGLEEAARIGRQVGLDLFLDVKINTISDNSFDAIVKLIDVETTAYVANVQFRKSVRDEDTPDSLFVKAETNYANGEYKKAADRFARIYDSLAESVDRDERLLARKSLRYAGTAYYMAGEYQMAIESVAVFRTAFGEDEELSFYLAHSLYYLGNTEKAEQTLRQLIESASYYHKAYILLSDILSQQRRFDEAILILDSIPRTSDDYYRATFKKALIYERQLNSPKALELYREVYGNSELDQPARYNHSRLLFVGGQFSRAVESVKELIQKYPGYREAYDLVFNVLLSLLANNYSLDEVDKLTNWYIETKERNIGIISLDYYLRATVAESQARELLNLGREKDAKEVLKKTAEYYELALEYDDFDGALTEEQIDHALNIIEKHGM